MGGGDYCNESPPTHFFCHLLGVYRFRLGGFGSSLQTIQMYVKRWHA